VKIESRTDFQSKTHNNHI